MSQRLVFWFRLCGGLAPLRGIPAVATLLSTEQGRDRRDPIEALEVFATRNRSARVRDDACTIMDDDRETRKKGTGGIRIEEHLISLSFSLSAYRKGDLSLVMMVSAATDSSV